MRWFWGFLLVVSGCAPEGSYRLHVFFPDGESRQLVHKLTISAVDPQETDCGQVLSGQANPQTIYATLNLEPFEGGEVSLQNVPAGDILFMAEGETASGVLFLLGCQVEGVRAGKTADVNLHLQRYCRDEIPHNDFDDDCDGLTDECLQDSDCDDDDPCTVDACVDETCEATPLDADGDGYVSSECQGDDCDDGNGAVNPGESEGPFEDPTCRDGLDNDCDGLTDGYDADDCRALVVVEPVYPLNTDWNAYVKNDEPTKDAFHQTDTACDGTEALGYAACIHAGEKRMVTVDGLDSCAGLSANDALGAFEWTCQDQGGSGPVTFYTVGLKKGAGLKDLLDLNGFIPNSIAVTDTGSQAVLAASEPAVWGWNNPLEVLPDNSSSEVVRLDEEWKIYFLPQSRTSNGYNINADRIALVNLDGAVLAYAGSSDDNCNSASGEYVPGYASSKCLIASGEQKFLWIEGDFDSDSPSGSDCSYSLVLHNITFSRINNVSSTGASYIGLMMGDCENNYFYNVDVYDSGNRGVSAGDCNYNVFEGLSSVVCGEWGMVFGGDPGGHHNSFMDVYVDKSAQRGFVLYDGQYNTIVNLTVIDSGDYAGVNIYDQHNRLYNVHSHHNDGSGIVITDSFNTVVNAVLTNNSTQGLRVFNSSRNITDTTVVNLLAANNGNSGLSSQDSSHQNTFSHVTAVHNLGSGVLVNGGDNCVLNQILAVNNSQFGIGIAWGSPTDDTISQAACGYNGDHNIRSTGCQDNVWTGNLLVEDIADNCLVEPGTNPGLIDNTCTDTGEDGSSSYTGQLSDARLHLVDLSASFVGKVAQDDPVNPSDSFGSQIETLIADWSHFETIHRVWGVDGTAFPADDNRGDCGSGTCRIWDWRLSAAETELLNFNGGFQEDAPCPDSVHGNLALTDGQTTPNIFLPNATEILFDPLGDDDGLCETGEACVFSPNFGFYQGEGELTLGTCIFQDGLVAGVQMYAYSANGL
jgi:hypothetical protein